MFLYGRYRKLSRELPQTRARWRCPACRGPGCAACGGTGRQFASSVEELIAPIFRARMGAAAARAVRLIYNPEFLREGTAVKDYF